MRQDLEWASYWGSSSKNAIDNFEKTANARLSEIFKEIIEFHNGAHLKEKSSFRFFCKSQGGEAVRDLGLMHAFGSIDSTTETMEWSFANRPASIPAGVISFSRDGGGNLLCFDYRKNFGGDHPTVVWWDSEAEQLSFVADGFDEFLNMLFEA